MTREIEDELDELAVVILECTNDILRNQLEIQLALEQGRLSISRWRSSRVSHADRVDLDLWFSSLNETPIELCPTTFVEVTTASDGEPLLDSGKFSLLSSKTSNAEKKSAANSELRQRNVATKEAKSSPKQQPDDKQSVTVEKKERPASNSFKTLVFGPFCGTPINSAEKSFDSALELACQSATLRSRLIEAQRRFEEKRQALALHRQPIDTLKQKVEANSKYTPEIETRSAD